MSGAALSWLLTVAAAGAAGFGAGLVHFRSLSAVTGRLLAGDLGAVPIQLVRLAALGGLLWLLALVGAHALLAGAGGVLVARSRVLARTGGGR